MSPIVGTKCAYLDANSGEKAWFRADFTQKKSTDFTQKDKCPPNSV